MFKLAKNLVKKFITGRNGLKCVKTLHMYSKKQNIHHFSHWSIVIKIFESWISFNLKDSSRIYHFLQILIEISNIQYVRSYETSWLSSVVILNCEYISGTI